MQELEITISNDGRVLVRVMGVKGEECLSLTKNLENAVGDVKERSCTSEYYEQPVRVTDQTCLKR